MKKFLLIYFGALLISAALSAQPAGDCVVNTYTSQIGVREATGRNDGVQVETYLASTKLTKGNPWCAAFVNWSLKQCGYKTPNSGWSPHWFPADHLVAEGRPGDVFGIYFPDKKRIAHVGFIDEWGSRSVKTVEGNTNGAGSREGNGVYRKIRLRSQLYKISRWTN